MPNYHKFYPVATALCKLATRQKVRNLNSNLELLERLAPSNFMRVEEVAGYTRCHRRPIKK